MLLNRWLDRSLVPSDVVPPRQTAGVGVKSILDDAVAEPGAAADEADGRRRAAGPDPARRPVVGPVHVDPHRQSTHPELATHRG